MSCTQFSSDAAERYVAGTMPEPERSAFEDHFFDCETCFANVQASQALTAALRHDHTPITPIRRTSSSPRRWLPLAAALVLAAGAVALWRSSASPEPESLATASLPAQAPPPAAPVEPVAPPAPPVAPSREPDATPAPPATRSALLTELALFTPPVYLRMPSRGAAADAADAVDAALAGYSDRQYDRVAAALTGLLPTLTGEPASRAAFYLGIVELLRGRVAEGQAALMQVVHADVPPYRDEAHFYLGKAALAAGNEPVARDELTMAIKAEAGPEGEAARMLARLSRQ